MSQAWVKWLPTCHTVTGVPQVPQEKKGGGSLWASEVQHHVCVYYLGPSMSKEYSRRTRDRDTRPPLSTERFTMWFKIRWIILFYSWTQVSMNVHMKIRKSDTFHSIQPKNTERLIRCLKQPLMIKIEAMVNIWKCLSAPYIQNKAFYNINENSLLIHYAVSTHHSNLCTPCNVAVIKLVNFASDKLWHGDICDKIKKKF